MALDVSFDQIMQVAGGIVASLAAAVGGLVIWIQKVITAIDARNQKAIAELIVKLDACEAKHYDATRQIGELLDKTGELRGRLAEVERMNPSSLADQVASAVAKILKGES